MVNKQQYMTSIIYKEVKDAILDLKNNTLYSKGLSNGILYWNPLNSQYQTRVSAFVTIRLVLNHNTSEIPDWY